MQHVDVYFDPACPWAWMVSRWMLAVREVRDVEVAFRPLSLAAINEGRDEPGAGGPPSGKLWRPVRVFQAALAHGGPAVVEPLYNALGRRIHLEGADIADPEVLAAALAEAGLPENLAAAAESTAFDETLRADRRAVGALVGDDVGTPVITVEGVSFFGPVISPAPTGEEAGRLFDGCLLLAGYPGFFELKRTRTLGPILT